MNSTDIADETPENSTIEQEGGQEGDAVEPKVPLTLDVKIAAPSTCERHVTVTISREDIDRYFKDAINDLLPKAEVPGFRIGRAPRKLIESRFRDTVRDQIKGALLMDSITQINESKQFTAISEPSFNLESVVLPDEGPMTYEFDIEVRPDFDMPNWKGLTLTRPMHNYSDEEVDRHLSRVLERYSSEAPVDGAAEAEDFVTVNAEFSVDGAVVSTLPELRLRVRPILTFQDARIEDGAALLGGAKAGDIREGRAAIAPGVESPHAGKTAQVKVEVLDVKRLERPELNAEFLQEIGGFMSADELRGFLRSELEKQFRYHQQKNTRQQITSQLTANANWQLPPDLLKRQAKREFDRAILELRSSGFSDEQIQAYANQIKQNSVASTMTALKEHFILERIAEQENIDALPADYDAEVKLIADQSDESPRRVRARLEKRGLMDTLRNQIVERKVIEVITGSANISDEPFTPPTPTEFAVDAAICSATQGDNEIPEAKHGNSGNDELKPSAER